MKSKSGSRGSNSPPPCDIPYTTGHATAKLTRPSFTIWQLRTTYLSTIKDGIGDRLININNSVLNTPGFRAAGWSSAPTNPSTQSATANIKRTYSPPIPTTKAVSPYYRLDVNGDGDDALGTGPGDGDEGEDEEGGMVTGKSTADITGRRNAGRGGKKTRRKDRQQEPQLRQGEAEEDDSSDLSDESDDDGDPAQRLVSLIWFKSSFLLPAEALSRSSSRKCRSGYGLGRRQFALRTVKMVPRL